MIDHRPLNQFGHRRVVIFCIVVVALAIGVAAGAGVVFFWRASEPTPSRRTNQPTAVNLATDNSRGWFLEASVPSHVWGRDVDRILMRIFSKKQPKAARELIRSNVSVILYDWQGHELGRHHQVREFERVEGANGWLCWDTDLPNPFFEYLRNEAASSKKRKLLVGPYFLDITVELPDTTVLHIPALAFEFELREIP